MIAQYPHLHDTTEVEKQSVTDQVEYGAIIDDLKFIMQWGLVKAASSEYEKFFEA